MNSNLQNLLAFFFLLFLLFISGCSSLSVVDLKEQPISTRELKKLPDATVVVERINVISDSYGDADMWQQGLIDTLRNERVFKSVSQLVEDKENFDLVIRGNVKGDFRLHGARNFFTWWPGPFFYAQAWRGTRFIYDAYTDIEVVDAHTGEVLGMYHAENSQELIHRSYNPWHFFGTALLIPGIVKGSINVAPRAKYRQLLYEATYSKLWKKIILDLTDDQLNIYSKRMALLKKKCGDHFNEEIKIGMLWSEFISCQTTKYKFLGEETREMGIDSVYFNEDKLTRIYVANDGRIIRWFISKIRH